MRTPAAFLDWLATDAGVWRALPAGASADAALDRRDEPETEEAWLQENVEVQRRLHALTIPRATTAVIDAIAEQAFTKAFDATGHHGLAAQVSDDLRLLAEATIAGYESPTLDRLWAAYSGGLFPDRLTDEG